MPTSPLPQKHFPQNEKKNKILPLGRIFYVSISPLPLPLGLHPQVRFGAQPPKAALSAEMR